MDNRIPLVYEAMRRVAQVVETRSELKSLASESLALEHFSHTMKEFERLAKAEAEAVETLAYCQTAMGDIRTRLGLELACIQMAAKFAEGDGLSVLDSDIPDVHADPVTLYYRVHGYLSLAEREKEDLIAAGMHPRKTEDARKSLDQFVATHREWSDAERYLDNSPNLLQLWREAARKRTKQLAVELAPAMQEPTVRLEWKSAAALGRTHRPKRLSAPKKQLLLGDGTSSSDGTKSPAVEEASASIEEASASINEGNAAGLAAA